jgi:hypothetical protein
MASTPRRSFTGKRHVRMCALHASTINIVFQWLASKRHSVVLLTLTLPLHDHTMPCAHLKGYTLGGQDCHHFNPHWICRGQRGACLAQHTVSCFHFYQLRSQLCRACSPCWRRALRAHSQYHWDGWPALCIPLTRTAILMHNFGRAAHKKNSAVRLQTTMMCTSFVCCSVALCRPGCHGNPHSRVM